MNCRKWALSHCCQYNHFLQVWVIHQLYHPGIRWLAQGRMISTFGGRGEWYSLFLPAEANLQPSGPNKRIPHIRACGVMVLTVASLWVSAPDSELIYFLQASSKILLTFTFSARWMNISLLCPTILSWLIPNGIVNLPFESEMKNVAHALTAWLLAWLNPVEVPG